MAKTAMAKIATSDAAELRRADSEKTSRLRALRLAKEADDRRVAEQSALLVQAKPKRAQSAAGSVRPHPKKPVDAP